MKGPLFRLERSKTARLNKSGNWLGGVEEGEEEKEEEEEEKEEKEEEEEVGAEEPIRRRRGREMRKRGEM